MIDITFNMHLDANWWDPDATSPTLRKYHQILWNKNLPNGEKFSLSDKISGKYLVYFWEKEIFHFWSDAIAHSYRTHKRKKFITEQIPDEVSELFQLAGTIGGYIIFPKNRVNNLPTINQERWVNPLIDDRFDLTLECIRRFYRGEKSPLFETLSRYQTFFELFENFENYINFFLLNDLIDENGNIKFYLPFDNFSTKPEFKSVSDYLHYKKNVMNFVNSRNARIVNFCKNNNPS